MVHLLSSHAAHQLDDIFLWKPIHYACKNGFLSFFNFQSNLEFIENNVPSSTILNLGGEKNRKLSPLSIALHANQLDVFIALLNSGLIKLDILQEDSGDSYLIEAIRLGKEKFARVLIEYDEVKG